MPSPMVPRGRALGLLPLSLVAVCAVVAVQFVNFGDAAGNRTRTSASAADTFQRPSARAPSTTTTTSTVPPTTTTTSAPTANPPSTTPAPPPPPPAPVAAPPASGGLPQEGRASAWGCAAAIAYLQAYAHPGFTIECPGDALGREGMTCLDEPGICPGEAIIAIADPCPAAYMNEASNSWVLEGQSTAPIDPYGTC